MASWFAGNASADVTCPGPVLQARQFTDPVRTFAYGTDASFYRLNPKLVVKVHTEDEIRRVLPIARRLAVPVTFRAAGTSLSGQAITDSVLLKLSHTGKNFRDYTIHVSQPLLWQALPLAPPLMQAAGPLTGSLQPALLEDLLSGCLHCPPSRPVTSPHACISYACPPPLSRPPVERARALCRGMATRSLWSLA